jgi:hypothetical protein
MMKMTTMMMLESGDPLIHLWLLCGRGDEIEYRVDMMNAFFRE